MSIFFLMAILLVSPECPVRPECRVCPSPLALNFS